MTTVRPVDEEYDRIRASVLGMGGLVEEMMEKAGRALASRDTDLAASVVRADRQVDTTEKLVDELCRSILARQQPLAVDLRFLVAAMKITTDLERVGDLAGNIGRSVLELCRFPQQPLSRAVGGLFQESRRMLADSLDAFVRRDSELARDVWSRDDAYDAQYHEVIERLLQAGESDPKAVAPTFQLILIGRSLERMADHATNIAEDVIYYVEGIDIRHSATDYGDSEGNAR